MPANELGGDKCENVRCYDVDTPKANVRIRRREGEARRERCPRGSKWCVCVLLPKLSAYRRRASQSSCAGRTEATIGTIVVDVLRRDTSRLKPKIERGRGHNFPRHVGESRRGGPPHATMRERLPPRGCRALLFAIVALILPGGPVYKPVLASNVFAKMQPLGDRGFHGDYGPPGRSGHSAVVNDESRMFVFGGKVRVPNGDYLNDMWLYDWNTGNWTAYNPNELVCEECSVCASERANQEDGHKYIKADDGSFITCPDDTRAEWEALSVTSRSFGAQCEYHTTCFDWTGLRPYAEPNLESGTNRPARDLPSGRWEHQNALVLNRLTGERDTLVMFGGYSVDCVDYCDDLWHYNIPRSTWTKIANFTKPVPTRRWKHAMVDYLDAVFMFGGHGQRKAKLLPGQTVDENEIYDDVTRYDPTNPLYFDDLWSYNVTEREWELLKPFCVTCENATEPDGTTERDIFGPRGRHSPSLANYDDALYLFGGYAFGGVTRFNFLYPTGAFTDYQSLNSKYYMNDLWKYNISVNEWQEMFPHPNYPIRPQPRFGHASAISIKEEHVVMLVYGGYTWDDEIGDLWYYNISGDTWVKVVGEGEYPSRRYRATMVPVGHTSQLRTGSTQQAGRALIFGGHGCLKGVNYFEATKSKVLSQQDRINNVDLQWDTQYDVTGDGKITVRRVDVDPYGDPILSTNPDLWIQTPNDYCEKYCYEELDDLWQYFPTSCPKDCSRHGSCVYNFCVCDTGYTGFDCSNVSCPDDVCYFDYLGHSQVCDQCNNRGICNGFTGSCECQFPASGESCRAFDCLNDCNGNGICDHSRNNSLGYGVCECFTQQGRPAYEGLDCSIPVCPWNPANKKNDTCSSRGICVNGTCVCHPGYGDSFIHRELRPPEGALYGIRVPTDYDDNPILGCGYDEEKEEWSPAWRGPKEANPETGVPQLPECEPIFIADCGDVLFTFAGAGLYGAPWVFAIALAWIAYDVLDRRDWP